MDEEVSNSAAESALEAAFGNAAPEPPKAAPAPKVAPAAPAKAEAPEAPVEEEPEVDPADLLQDEPEPEAKTEAEPSFEIEIEAGKPETLPLSRLKELAQRGAKAGRGFEENARVREALTAHVQQAQMHQQFQQAVSPDIAQIQAIEQQLQQYEKVDWNTIFSDDPFKGMQLKEQRDQLREQRAAAIHNLNAKRQHFDAQFRENSQRLLHAESEALLAKVPAWRNAEKANQERGEIAGVLVSHFGFTQAEVGQLMDHRMLLVARDAAAYRKLLANKDARVKQAREAPQTAKPGAAPAQPNGRVEFNKFRGKVRELGTKGNHAAQERLMTQALDRVFK